jgi:putrescine aminotransferase
MASEHKARVLRDSSAHLVPGRVERLCAGGIDFVPERREGYRYWDIDGREVLDLHLNGGTFNLGHCNPQLVERLRDCAGEWDIGNHHFPSRPKVELARALIATIPGTMQYVVYTPSGSEANDVAIKSARWATGRSKVVALAAGYHGSTGLSGAAGNDETARYFGSDDPLHFVKVPFNDLAAMEGALRNRDVALVMMETIPATSGFPLPEEDYLPGVKALCERYGTLFLADEVQTGLGRTGRPWAIEAYGVEPDMLVTGKGLSGGLYPIAAVVMTERCGSWLREKGWGHVSTFGGSDLGCHVAIKALAMSMAESTLENVSRMAGYLRDGLDKIMARFPFFCGIRQMGLVMGLQFDSDTTSYLMMKALYENGIWAIVAAFDETVIQFKPGLLIDTAFCDEVLARFERACIWYVANANNILMAVNTDAAAVNEAQRYTHGALAAWGLENAGLELIKHRENTVYRVQTTGGRRYALRVHRPGYHSPAEIESEIRWMRALANDGIPTAEPIATPAGDWVRAVSIEGKTEQRLCSVFTWHDGVLFDNLGAVEKGMLTELVARYRQLGALAARVHNQGERWQACYGLIHADLLPENILMKDGELRLIDFDDCGYGWYMFEMATSVFPRIAEPYFDTLVDAYVEGYRSQRPFSDEHLQLFPAFILLRGLTYLGWLMTRAEGLVNRDRIARQIIDGLCEHIPELLNELGPVQRIGVNAMAWWQARDWG